MISSDLTPCKIKNKAIPYKVSAVNQSGALLFRITSGHEFTNYK